MLNLPFEGKTIQISNDSSYSLGSADNLHRYEKVHRLDDTQEYRPSSLHAVRIFDGDEGREIASGILCASGGATGIHKNSAFVHGNALILAVGPYAVSLQLPTLQLNWKTQVDQATCFGVYHSPHHACYISHGEIEIARFSYAGKVEWARGGRDIFTEGFTLNEQTIEATDFNNDHYRWDIQTGKMLQS